MTRFDPKSLEHAFVLPGTLSLADCLARIEQNPDLSPVRRRDLASGLRRLATALRRPLALLPADPAWLQPRLARLEPADLELSAKTWSNILSNARAALTTCGIVDQRIRRLDDLSPQWLPLWNAVRTSDNLTFTTTLGRLVRFLDNTAVAPDEVGPEHIELYRQALETNEIRRSPEEGVRQARYAWNRATKLLADWPQQSLPVPKSDKVYGLPLATFPHSFAEDLARYVAARENPDRLDPMALNAAQRAATVKHRRGQLLRFASVLVHAGVDAGAITSLATLVEPVLMKRGFAWLLERQGGQTSPGLADLAIALTSLARHHVRLSPEEQRPVDNLTGRLAMPRAAGLTTKNRERLRRLGDPKVLEGLLALPFRLFEAMRGKAGRTAALRREEALAMALLLFCPIRRRNLTSLHLERNLRRMGDGGVFLVFDGSEVKNRRPIEFELPQVLIQMIDEQLATRPTSLVPAGTPWLFPRRKGGASIEPSHFQKRISARIRKETGLEVHVHLFRHLAAKIWLEANPGQYEALRRLLGHAALSSTLSAYIGFEAGTATRLFGELIEGKIRGGKA